jgi:hypothetical protein
MENICTPIQRSNKGRFLSNDLNTSVIPEEKRLQIIAQNETHISIVMPCSSEVMDESKNVFRIEGPYDLNCRESRNFRYIEQVKTWRGQKCCDWNLIIFKENDILKCGFCQNWCKVIDRCFWEGRTTGVSVFKNNETI